MNKDKPFSESDISKYDDLENAVKEAKRCLQCANPLCRTGCPVENDIPGFIKALSQGNIGFAAEILALRSNLPAVCGRICPHELQCEAHCILAQKQKEIKIGSLEKFIADMASELNVNAHKSKIKPIAEGRVAVIGSGPAGITVAGDLVKLGFTIDVYENQPEPGGVLMYGIPEFRLPKLVVRREIQKLQKLGVKFHTNVMIGQDLLLDKLFAEGFDAICIATGNALPRSLDVPGENLNGVVPAIYFLQMVTLAETGKIENSVVPVKYGDKVVVIGGGNVALDAARSAKRRGASSVTLAFREKLSETKMLKHEIESAEAEGVQFKEGMTPVEIIGGDLTIASMPNLIKASKVKFDNGEILPADAVFVAIGQRPAQRIVSTTTGIETLENGRVKIKERPFGLTTRSGVFASGDVVHGPSTVVVAMREAKKVAGGIAAYIEAKKLLGITD
jgi:glutamate synthase (NADPH/NADH) small chain